MNTLINKARHLPVRPTRQTIAINPVTLPATARGQDLQLRITAPIDGTDLPIVLLSHGGGPSLYVSSKDGYGPLVDFYAGQGFAVIQPTHASSRVAGLPNDAPGAPLFWRSRVNDMTLILDNLDAIERLVPAIAGRLDHTRIAVVGHSLGGQTAGILLGAHLTDAGRPEDTDISMIDPRIKVGVMLTPPGNGGDELTETVRARFTEFNPDYTYLTTNTLVVVGDADANSDMQVVGPDWYTAAFRDGPGAKAMLTMHGGKHGLGGIAGYDAKETDDEDPDRLATTLRMTMAWLRSALYDDDLSWQDASIALTAHASDLAHIDNK